jgi:indolepyruvate ferredoxin oxidoreductase
MRDLNVSTFDLQARLTADSGIHYLPGMQALMRLTLEQARRDRASGLRIGGLITGYPGSPIGGLDLQLARNKALLEEHDLRHLPGGNEEQAVTALTGTQMLDDYPHDRYDGVAGWWYGKGPGVDRSGDALKHGNFAGTSKHGSVVVLSGEDHEAKSSTMPFEQEYAFQSAGIPILYPGTIADIRRLGLHAVALSRYSGCWVAMKLVTQVCDSGATVDVGEPVDIVLPELRINGSPFVKRTDFTFYPGANIEQERHLYDERHLAVLTYARANDINRVLVRHQRDRVGIISAGKSTADLRQGLRELGVSDAALEEMGIRILDLGMIYPLDEQLVRDFADGLERIVVIEEKRGVLEQAVRAALQRLGRRIDVVGKRDLEGRSLFPVQGGMDADAVVGALDRALGSAFGQVAEAPRITKIAGVRGRGYATVGGRTPNFCSGCPHSTSTVLAPGQIAWGAPGCGAFNTVIEQPERHIDTMTQYGGEGLSWIGLAPFTEREHIVQHVGDGSLYHSSYLNIRFAVAAGAHMTFKVLFNGVVANTGAQLAIGSRGVGALVKGLAAEGVERMAIVTKEREQYRSADLPDAVEVRDVSELVAVSGELERFKGVSVLIYDESCANERRRRQKRGKLPAPTKHLLINERVCEGCGDCGSASNCMSLQRVETTFGTKTQIDGSSCNDDYSCLAGDCPSFVSVEIEEGTGLRRPSLPSVDPSILPEPARVAGADEPFHLYMPGVGGTGVITVNAMLAVAAQIDGLYCLSYDQTGAAQKWGSVLSSLVISDHPITGSKVGLAQADLVLALDEVTACASANLDRCDPTKTTAVLNTDLFPTGEMVRDVTHEVDVDGLRNTLREWTRPDAVEVPARTLAERLFGDTMLTNIIVIGAAYQAGHLPLSAASIEAAIRANGVSVESNLTAFRIGRQWVADPAPLKATLFPPARSADQEIAAAGPALGRHGKAYEALIERTAGLSESLRAQLAVFVAELVRYQSVDYATAYLDIVLRVAEREGTVDIAEGQLTATVARNLFKLMAYKDEYEVARLFLADDFAAGVKERFEAPKHVYYHLHPPALRRLGRREKIRIGRVARPVFIMLRAGRRLRGTPFDPFGRQPSRREERELIDWYLDLIERGTRQLGAGRLVEVVELLDLPDQIRGYEEVKSRNAAKARMRAGALLKRLERKGDGLEIAVVQAGRRNGTDS